MVDRSELRDELTSFLEAEEDAERRYAEAEADLKRLRIPHKREPDINDPFYAEWAELSDKRFKHNEALKDARKSAFYALVRAKNAAASARLRSIDNLIANAADIRPFRLEEVGPVVHPPFDGRGLETPSPPPELESPPPEPVYRAPDQLGGFRRLFGGKARYEELEREASAKWRDDHDDWKDYVAALQIRNRSLLQQHDAAEELRRSELANARSKYEQECAEREQASQRAAADAKALSARVLANDPGAVLEFLRTIVLHSSYPSVLSVSSKCGYDPETREATIALSMVAPSDMPVIKSYEWFPSTIKVYEQFCSETEQKKRYNKAVSAVAVRTIFQTFSAEPSGVIETLSLTVGAQKTSRHKLFQFVAAAVASEDLGELGGLEPIPALKRLNASVSKNPFGLQVIDDNRGISK